MFALRASTLLLLCALVGSSLASSILEDPYTLPDGSVVDPTNPETAPRANSADSIYMPLSHNGPMSGMGQRHHNPSGGNPSGGNPRKRQLGIRSEQDDGYLV